MPRTRPTILELDRSTIDLSTGRVQASTGEEGLLTPMELQLLEALAEARGGTVTREALQAKLWEEPWDGRSRRLDMLVRRTRIKLGDSTRPPRIIQTRYGAGFRLVSRRRPVPTPTSADLASIRARLQRELSGVDVDTLAQAVLPMPGLVDAVAAHAPHLQGDDLWLHALRLVPEARDAWLQRIQALDGPAHDALLRLACCAEGVPRRWLAEQESVLIQVAGAVRSTTRLCLPRPCQLALVEGAAPTEAVSWFTGRVVSDAGALQAAALSPRAAEALARGVDLVSWLVAHPALLAREQVVHVVDCLSPLYRYCIGPDRIVALTDALERVHAGVDLTGPATYLRNRGAPAQMVATAERAGPLWGPALVARAYGRAQRAQEELARHAEEAWSRDLVWLAHHAELGRAIMRRGRTEMAAQIDAHMVRAARLGLRGPLWEADLALAEAIFLYTDSGTPEAVELLHHAAEELRSVGATVRGLHGLSMATEHRVSTDDLDCLDIIDRCIAEARQIGAQRVEGWFLDYRMTTLFALGQTAAARRCALAFHATVARWDPMDARRWSTRLLRAIDLMGSPDDAGTRARAARVGPVFAAAVELLEEGAVGDATLRAAEEVGGVVPETLRALGSKDADKWLSAPDPTDIRSRLDPIDRRLLRWAMAHTPGEASTHSRKAGHTA